MKNKFEYDYLENDFERFYNFITVYTTSSEHETNVKKIFQKIENHYKDACVFIKEQSGIIDQFAEGVSSLEIKNQRLEFDNHDLNNQIHELDNKLDEYFDKIRELEIEVESLR